MTPEIAAIDARIAAFEAALDAFLLGSRTVEVAYDGRTVKFAAAQASDLRTRLTELKAERARLEREAGLSNRRYGAIRPVIS